ncbi:hypothetical protein DFH06DRAFT_1149436 [Mycena polygramma]|nr:hypothetical protein DFH06DRAFT_1149436 [Mycena polygramma]
MTPRVAEHSEDLGAAESADSAGMIGIGGGIVGDVLKARWNASLQYVSFGTPRIPANPSLDIERSEQEPQWKLKFIRRTQRVQFQPGQLVHAALCVGKYDAPSLQPIEVVGRGTTKLPTLWVSA